MLQTYGGGQLKAWDLEPLGPAFGNIWTLNSSFDFSLLGMMGMHVQMEGSTELAPLVKGPAQSQ